MCFERVERCQDFILLDVLTLCDGDFLEQSRLLGGDLGGLQRAKDDRNDSYLAIFLGETG
jgi:hypothetical protein